MGGGFSGSKSRSEPEKQSSAAAARLKEVPESSDDRTSSPGKKSPPRPTSSILNDGIATRAGALSVKHVLANRPQVDRPVAQLDKKDQLGPVGWMPRRKESVMVLVSKKRTAERTKTKRMSAMLRINGVVRDLPRGGTYVQTKSCGAIQFGLPPETIKDIMGMGLELPTYYIIPHKRFDLEKGLNVAEFEFPAYFNFFIKRRRINLVCAPDVEPLIRTVFTETLLGPRNVEWPKTYSKDVPKSAYPDLAKEMAYFSKNPFNPNENLSVDTLISFTHFKNGEATLYGSGSHVKILENDEEFSVFEDGQCLVNTPTDILLRDIVEQEHDERDSHSNSSNNAAEGHIDIERMMTTNFFTPPYFGVTMLGNSDGFDKTGSTTGFVLWLNQRGIMIDPPPYSGAVLKRVGIHPRLITGMIVTHCHADHDAGAFQKILEEGIITLYTTQVICDSFLRKYSAISGLTQDFLKRLFHFRPVHPGEEVHVYGGFLKFFYSLHSIPCVGFECHHFGHSMIYSADTLNDPVKIRQIQKDGYMSEGRAEKLIDFPWGNHDIILHEAGVPPIHTPLTTFESLSDEIKERLYIVHKNPATVPLEQGLKPALVGAENTIIISNEKPPNFDAMEILELLGNTDLFKELPFHRGTELVQCAQTGYFKAEQDLIVEGTFGDHMYFIALGFVAVLVGPKRKQVKLFSTGDHFGAQSMIAEGQAPRTATISAITDCKVLMLHRNAFHFLVRGTDTVERLIQLGSMQMSESWQVINLNSCLEQLTSTQKTYLQSILQPRRVLPGEVLWRQRNAASEAILVVHGTLIFEEAPEMQPFSRGALVGEFRSLLMNAPCSTTLKAAENCEIYAIGKEKLTKFLTDSPGLLLRLMPLFFVE